MLDGDRMAASLYDITFKETFEQKVLCKLMLGEEDISVLQNAIEDLYYFEFVYGKLRMPVWIVFSNTVVLDDLPIRGFLGHLEEGPVLPHNHKTYLWTHLHFTFEYNGKQVLYILYVEITWLPAGNQGDISQC